MTGQGQRVEMMMGGRYDAFGCQINIYAGAGGDEACDWVCMLERMYTGYAEQKGWSTKRLDFTAGRVLKLKVVSAATFAALALDPPVRSDEFVHS
eukprot:Skav212812  [mRNA]  locus=scaffold1633:264044:267482:- [translate_table: standard]